MNILIFLIGFLLISYMITEVGKLLKIPQVVTLIISGIFLGMPYIRSLMTQSDINVVMNIGDFGLLCLMFLAGIETKSSLLKKEFREATWVSLFAAFIPFILGFVIFYLLGYTIYISLIVGICLSITAEATQARVLMDVNKLKSKIGTLIMEAGIIDDILGLGIFILITFISKNIYLKEDLLLGATIFAFFVGVMMQKNGNHNEIIRKVEKIMYVAIVPFFFVSMGLHFDISSLHPNKNILLIILIIAFTGKILGPLLIKPFNKLSWKQLYLIGWAMNSRGAIELALALIAFRTKLIPLEIYSSLVVMALITTLTFPFVITRMIKKNPKIMN
ncbi:cation:proton antiporter [Candidatus Peregrinibacteria bacterium]|nr:cation:proton antiporter [Candidatus Peregrinibacteria bacterium]